MAETYDAVVIGAGVVGASTAFHLAKLGGLKVCVVDRGPVCGGTTPQEPEKSGAGPLNPENNTARQPVIGPVDAKAPTKIATGRCDHEVGAIQKWRMLRLKAFSDSQ